MTSAAASDRPVLLIIFGAGASFDSADPTNAIPPPLAVDLASPNFNEISQRYPPAQPIIDRLRRRLASEAGATSLEAELAVLAKDGSADRRAQMMAFSFYLHDVIKSTASAWLRAHSGYTRYLTLLDEIAEWRREVDARVEIVSFNYDVLAERALEAVVTDWTFGTDLRDYINRSDFHLFKLHGSTQWSRMIALDDLGARIGRSFRPLPGQNTLPAATQLAAAAVSVSGLPIAGVPPTGEFDSSNAVRIPALAVPIEGKMEFECPQEHVEMLRAGLPDVTHVLIVGWRGAERHAIQLLGGDGNFGGLAPGYALGIVSDSRDHAIETKTNLGEAGARGRQRMTIVSGFRGLIADLDQVRAFLKAPTISVR